MLEINCYTAQFESNLQDVRTHVQNKSIIYNTQVYQFINKYMVEISPRIQRLVVRSFPYQPFHIRYRKGMEIPLADALSRVTPLPMEEDGINLPKIAVNHITVNILCSSNYLDQICVETRKDPKLNLLIHYISNGWPCDQRQLPQELHLYWNFWEDLSVEDGLQPRVPDFSCLPHFKIKPWN